MPCILNHNFSKCSTVAVWKITEPEAYFRDQLHLSDRETRIVRTLSGRKTLEWYASRYLLKQLIRPEKPMECLYDTFGKPYLTGSDVRFSLSHSGDLAACAISDQPVGVDVQYITPKISRIAKKFVSPEEEKWTGPEREDAQLTTIWGAKEVMFKAYGKKRLDFRRHLRVHPFHFEKNGGTFYSELQKETLNIAYKLHYCMLESSILVYGVRI